MLPDGSRERSRYFIMHVHDDDNQPELRMFRPTIYVHRLHERNAAKSVS